MKSILKIHSIYYSQMIFLNKTVDVYETNFEHSVERKSIVNLNKSDIDRKIKEK